MYSLIIKIKRTDTHLSIIQRVCDLIDTDEIADTAAALAMSCSSFIKLFRISTRSHV
jgi:hypothetical protein